MPRFYLTMALILLLSVVAGLYRILRGPTAADRMMAAQLFGTCGVAVMLLLAKGLALPVIENVALIYALLGVLSTVAFVQRAWSGAGRGESQEPREPNNPENPANPANPENPGKGRPEMIRRSQC